MNNISAKHPVRHALSAALAAAAALSCLASCSKPAPGTPMERSRVLLRLFSDLERRDNDAALTDINAYRNLDPTNLDLSSFEHIVRSNGVIATAKAKLDAGDAAGAAAELDAYCLKYGDVSENVTAAKEKVDLLLEADRLNEKMLAADFSDDIRDAATDLSAFAGRNRALFPKLSSYAASKIREADELTAIEKADACVDIFQDALEASAAGRRGEAAVLAALLELNADSEQRADLEGWLLQNAANK